MSAIVHSHKASRGAQFSLQSLLWAMTIACVAVAPTYWLGPTYLIQAVLSLAMIGACLRAYSQGNFSSMCGYAFGGMVLGLFLAAIALLIHATLTLIACICGRAMSVWPRTFAIMLVAAFLLAYAFPLASSVDMIRRVDAMRARYPMQSLNQRLEFEELAKARLASQPGRLDVQLLAAEVDKNLTEMEERGEFDYRRDISLRRLHEASYASFVASQGFGVGRMMPIRPEDALVDARNVVELPLRVRGLSRTANADELRGIDLLTRADFLSRDRMGFVRSRDAVAGFEAHGFSGIGEDLDNKIDIRPLREKAVEEPESTSDPNWNLVRLELVSLLRHEEPRVYQSQTLPQMDQLTEVPHRALDDFEATALPKLKFQQDVVIDQKDDYIVMLGAVRAGKDCLQCHAGTRGELLGAFSYELTRLELSPTAH